MRGEMARATVYGKDPAATARRFEEEGAELIHVVDLDGAIAGAPRNLESVRAIRAAVGCQLDVSGGLRTMASVREAFASGADIVSIGSAAFLKPELIVEACGEFSGRIFGSVDVRDGKIAIKGWVETTELRVGDALARLRQAGVAAVTLTDVARDGTETGANVAMFSKVAEAAGMPIIASGGVAGIKDLRALKALFAKRVVAAITGRALYEGRFTLREAASVLASS